MNNKNQNEYGFVIEEGILLKYKGNEEIVVIPNSITKIKQFAFDGCESITSIVIPNSVTTIERYAFSGCNSLETIEVEEGNKIYCSENNCLIDIESKEIIRGCKNSFIPDDGSVTKIGDGAFDGCESLTSIVIPNSVTEIGPDAFEGCKSLTSIAIPNSVTKIDWYAFKGCESLRSIVIPNSVTKIEWYAFLNCNSLETIEVEEGNKVYCSKNNCLIDIERKEIIRGCKNSVIPEDGSVIKIGSYAFGGCESLTSIVIPNSVTKIGDNAFERCKSLTSIAIPNSVTRIGSGVFKECKSLTTIVIPNSVTEIGDSAFKECESLTSIVIPNSVTEIGNYVFSDCNSLETIEVEEGNKVYCSKNNCLIDIENKEIIRGCKNSVIPDDGSVTKIEPFAFEGCESLISIVIPNSITDIGSYVFSDCNSLEKYVVVKIQSFRMMEV